MSNEQEVSSSIFDRINAPFLICGARNLGNAHVDSSVVVDLHRFSTHTVSVRDLLSHTNRLVNYNKLNPHIGFLSIPEEHWQGGDSIVKSITSSDENLHVSIAGKTTVLTALYDECESDAIYIAVNGVRVLRLSGTIPPRGSLSEFYTPVARLQLFEFTGSPVANHLNILARVKIDGREGYLMSAFTFNTNGDLVAFDVPSCTVKVLDNAIGESGLSTAALAKYKMLRGGNVAAVNYSDIEFN